jgi:K+-sensing histidine kinase KdpD
MSSSERAKQSPAYEELQQENLALRRELERVSASREHFWKLLLETSRRLQVSSASIKAAVSSLLNYEIFWDPANQHEFLTTIDLSVDKVGRLISLFNLAFRAEAGSLELKSEPQSLHEILAVVQATAVSRHPKLQLKFSLPREGKPVLVDYEYLTIAFSFLFDLLAARENAGKIMVNVEEHARDWSMDIAGIDGTILELVYSMQACKLDANTASRYGQLPEHVLGLQVACAIFSHQEIRMEAGKNVSGEPLLHLIVPAFVNNPVNV